MLALREPKVNQVQESTFRGSCCSAFLSVPGIIPIQNWCIHHLFQFSFWISWSDHFPRDWCLWASPPRSGSCPGSNTRPEMYWFRVSCIPRILGHFDVPGFCRCIASKGSHLAKLLHLYAQPHPWTWWPSSKGRPFSRSRAWFRSPSRPNHHWKIQLSKLGYTEMQLILVVVFVRIHGFKKMATDITECVLIIQKYGIIERWWQKRSARNLEW